MKTALELIIEELRDLASRAHGDPSVVQVKGATLREYADAIEAHLNEPSVEVTRIVGAGGGTGASAV